jgi:hypothetical protein
MMKRVWKLPAVMASGLALTVLLGGCTRHEAASSASNKTDMTPVTVASDGLPEVVITAQRPAARPIVLSQSATGR